MAFRMFIFSLSFMLFSTIYGQSVEYFTPIIKTKSLSPKLIKPFENSNVFHKNIVLTWNSEDLESEYHLQIADSKHFSNIIFDTIICSSTCLISELSLYKEFYWRVNYKDKKDNYLHSEPSFFKTSNIMISDQDDENQIKLFPTNLGSTELLFIDNPELFLYDIKIFNKNFENRFHQISNSERKGIDIGQWPRGTYMIKLTYGNTSEISKEVILN